MKTKQLEREIRFRAWDKFKEIPDMVYFDLDMLQEGKTMLIGSIVDADVMQYTGLKDKNGKEIYEGDVIKDWEEIDLYKVIWNKVWACFDLERVTRNNDTEQEIDDTYNCEIIGNIYENPELLKIK